MLPKYISKLFKYKNYSTKPKFINKILDDADNTYAYHISKKLNHMDKKNNYDYYVVSDIRKLYEKSTKKKEYVNIYMKIKLK